MVLADAAVLSAFFRFGDAWWLVAAVIPIAAFVLALRVGARLQNDTLIVRSFLRNHTFPLTQVETFLRMPYQGFWGGGGPAGWIGLNQIDVEGAGYAWSRSLPATMCTRATAERLEDGLNRRIECLEAHST